MHYHNNIDGLTYFKTSAEYEVLCHQAYLLARHALKANLEQFRANNPKGQKPAVIFDIDETVLDNSEFNESLITEGRIFNLKRWNEWCSLKASVGVPGAREFMAHLVQEYPQDDIQIYYITSRDEESRAATVENLALCGLPVLPHTASPDYRLTNLFMAGMKNVDGTPWEQKTKYLQRSYIEQTRPVRFLLSIGDNLSDYVEDFVSKNPADQRVRSARNRLNEFGRDFVLLPNPVYGSFLDCFAKVGINAEAPPLPSYDAKADATYNPVRPPVSDAESPLFQTVRQFPSRPQY